MTTRRRFLGQLSILGTVGLIPGLAKTNWGFEPPWTDALGQKAGRHVLAFYYPWYGNPHSENGSGR